MKRLFDIIASFFGLLFTAPLLLPVMFLVWYQDKRSPFYIAPRVGKNERIYRMVKLRSMVMYADSSGVDSTSVNDNRITPVGQFIRSYKLDELTQLWNVFLGDMSLVGPRPNVKRETDLYTSEEKRLLSVRPGITDLSSIVFSDEGDILADESDPDLAYNQLIRPWKSRLGLINIDHQSFFLDFRIILITALAIVNRDKALVAVNSILKNLSVSEKVISVALREEKLEPYPPPGSGSIVMGR
jgi:lipopolysaccharide/colanic/teichoic acid biosynthesis glycosyltransferase